MTESFQIKVDFAFEAAHFLPKVGEGHPCRRLHGHSFRFSVLVSGPLDPEKEWLMDYGQIYEVVNPLVQEKLDHRFLNAVPGLENPTSENLARYLWRAIETQIPGLTEIIVHETCNTACHYRKQ